MDRIYRDNADVGIAFASGRRRNAIAAAVTDVANNALVADNQPLGHDGIEVEAGVAPSHARRGIKSVLRRIAKTLFQLVSPLVKPVAYRARGFLMAGQFDHMEHLHAVAMKKLAETEEAFRTEIDSIRSLVKEEAEDTRNTLNVALIAEMKYTRELLALALAQEKRAVQPKANSGQQEEQLERIETYAASSARRVAVLCSSNEILVRTTVGYMLCPAQDHALLAQLLDVGELETGTRLLIQRLLRSGSKYIDVGANIGMHVIAAARAMQGEGRIECFEPFAPTARLLEKSVFLNGYNRIVKVHQAAVASQAGSQPLFLGNTSGHHSLFPLPDGSAAEDMPVQVRVVSLDEALPSGTRVDLVKIDVEGAELEVLAGASRLLNENPDAGLIVECGVAHLRRAGIQLEEWLGRFQSTGLAWKVINPDDGHLEAWSPERLLESLSVNLFMARAGASAWRLAESHNE